MLPRWRSAKITDRWSGAIVHYQYINLRSIHNTWFGEVSNLTLLSTNPDLSTGHVWRQWIWKGWTLNSGFRLISACIFVAITSLLLSTLHRMQCSYMINSVIENLPSFSQHKNGNLYAILTSWYCLNIRWRIMNPYGGSTLFLYVLYLFQDIAKRWRFYYKYSYVA